MARTERNLELKDEVWEKFDQITNALGHDEHEETATILIQLGFAAISVSDKKHRNVKLIGGPRQEGPKCEKCGRRQVTHAKEVSVTIGAENPKGDT